MSRTLLSLAGFQVIISGRFWVIAEAGPQNAHAQGSIIHSGRSFFFIAPEMRCLDIVWVIISPRSSHPFGIPVIWNYIGVICELFVTDSTFPVLLDNLSV